MGILFRSVVRIVRLPFDLAVFAVRAVIWTITLPFRLLEIVLTLPWLFLGWLASLAHRTRSSPATIVRVWSSPPPGASSRYWTYVLFDARGSRVQIKLTYFQMPGFVRKYSVGDIGHLTYRGARLVRWAPASTQRPIRAPKKESKVFLSYAHEWRDEAAYIAQFLGARGAVVWFDEESLRVGDSLPGGVKKGIAGAKYFVPLFCPEYFASTWCMRELDVAMKAKRTLLPVKISPGHLVMPPHLARVYRKLGEPVFVDMRQRDPTHVLDQLVERIVHAK